MRFEFASAARIIFGPGTATQMGALAREFGRRALVTTGLDPAHSERILVAFVRGRCRLCHPTGIWRTDHRPCPPGDPAGTRVEL